MSELGKSIKLYQNNISSTQRVVISLGQISDSNNILNVSVDTDFIKTFIKLLKEKKLITSIETKNYRCYKYLNMEYRINDKSHKNYKLNLINSNNINVDNGNIRIKLLEIDEALIEEFPCLYNYNDIIDNNTIIINYDNMCDIYIISEKSTEDNSSINHRIEIHILNQTIYVDNLIKTINDLIRDYFNTEN